MDSSIVDINNYCKIVTISGLPASGKTTLCKALCNSHSSIAPFTGPNVPPYSLPAVDQKDFISSQQEKISIFLEVQRKAQVRNKVGLMVCDRGIQDFLCFTDYVLQNYFGLDLDSCLAVRAKLIPIKYQSDICIFLDVFSSTLEMRVEKRTKLSKGRGLKEYQRYWNFYREWFLAHPNVVQVEIFDEEIEQICQFLISLFVNRQFMIEK